MDERRPTRVESAGADGGIPSPEAVRGFAQCELWRSLSEDTECRVVLLSFDGMILAINGRAEGMLSRWTTPRVGGRYADCFPEAVRPYIEIVLGRVVEGHASREGEPVVSRYLAGGYHSISRARVVTLRDGSSAVLMVARTLASPVRVEAILEQVRIPTLREAVLGDLAALSDRELEVAMLIAAGMSDDEIAESLHRSVRTVHSHRRMIGRRLRVKSRAEIVRIMVDRGLVAETPGGASAQVARLRPPTERADLPELMNLEPTAGGQKAPA
ncbi:MAG: helix-turn-helix transcriptional regulator [Phycisphaerales bacterium]|jgi:DNA-binding CsgD family transcriptional regulator|nr:helix-turn-helix transcriptional regulator [Phycisphaerales bacterium]